MDPLTTFANYKAKVKNTISHYIEKKEPLKFYIGMQVKFIKEDSIGNKEEANSGFTARTFIILGDWNLMNQRKR